MNKEYSFFRRCQGQRLEKTPVFGEKMSSCPLSRETSISGKLLCNCEINGGCVVVAKKNRAAALLHNLDTFVWISTVSNNITEAEDRIDLARIND